MESGEMSIIDEARAHIADTRRMWVNLVNSLGMLPEPEPEPPAPWIEDVKAAAAKHFRVPLISLTAKRRDAITVHHRHVAIFVACEMTGKSLPLIGRRFDIDHTSVIHARNKIAQKLREGNKLVTADVEALRVLVRERARCR